MSNTPRTDEMEYVCDEASGMGSTFNRSKFTAFTRQLERELNAANARAEAAEKESMLQREQRENIAAGWKADDDMFRRVLPALRAENAELRKALESIRALKPVDMEGYSYFSSRMGLEPDEVFEICDAALSATPMNKEQP